MRLALSVMILSCSLLSAGCAADGEDGAMADSSPFDGTRSDAAVDEGGDDATAQCTPGPTELMAACGMDEDCASCLCNTYGQDSGGVQLCSKTCTGDDDCPSPSPGCNGKGICKRPP